MVGWKTATATASWTTAMPCGLYVTDVEGRNLRPVLRPPLRYQSHQGMERRHGSWCTRWSRRRAQPVDEERMRQRAFLYDVASGRLSPYAALDSAAARAGPDPGALKHRSTTSTRRGHRWHEQRWNGAVIAESDTYEMVEGNVYFPADAVEARALSRQRHAHHLPLEGHGQLLRRGGGWRAPTPTRRGTIPTPKDAAANIRDHVAFWKGVEVEKWECGSALVR